MRIRTVKPEFFNHESLFDLEHETGLPVRIAYIGLWCAADREGRFKWEPRRLKTQILPYDELQFSDVLDALSRSGFIIRYGQAGEFGQIPSFLDHQCINQREAQSTLPDPADAPDQCTHMHARASTCTHVGKGREGNKERNRERNKEVDSGSCSKQKPKKSKPETREEFDGFFRELGLFANDAEYAWLHWEGNSWTNNGKPILDWKATVRKWRAGAFFPSQKPHGAKESWASRQASQSPPPPDGPPKDYLEILNDEDIIPYEVKFNHGGNFARWRDLPEDARQKIRIESARRAEAAANGPRIDADASEADSEGDHSREDATAPLGAFMEQMAR